MVAPMDSPVMTEFVDSLERINALAQSSRGYVWRLQTKEGNATAIRPFGEEYLVNLSVWQDVGSLQQFVYQSAHVDIMRRRYEWFEKMRPVSMVLWWIPGGHRPTVTEARQKLQLLRDQGPTQNAFTFKKSFAKPAATGLSIQFDDSGPNP